LTPDQIVGCGLELVDEVGLSGFTTRALAERLGTYPATLYWHVGNRSQLLAAIVDRAIGEVAVEPPGSVDWQEWLRRGARSYRAVLHRHPNLAPVAHVPVQGRRVGAQPFRQGTGREAGQSHLVHQVQAAPDDPVRCQRPSAPP